MLWKTTLVIWSDCTHDPQSLEINDLAQEAVNGNSYCSKRTDEYVNQDTDPDWDGSEFFSLEDWRDDEL